MFCHSFFFSLQKKHNQKESIVEIHILRNITFFFLWSFATEILIWQKNNNLNLFIFYSVFRENRRVVKSPRFWPFLAIAQIPEADHKPFQSNRKTKNSLGKPHMKTAVWFVVPQTAPMHFFHVHESFYAGNGRISSRSQSLSAEVPGYLVPLFFYGAKSGGESHTGSAL